MIIVIANHKGGVGKTTTSINLAAGCAIKGKKVLLIDLDPQSNSTSAFLDQSKVEGSVYEFLSGDIEWKDCVYKTKTKNLDIIPSKINFAKIESKLASEFDAIFKLKDKIEPIKDSYDLIIFDTPPALGIIAANAMVAATHLIIPVQASYFALEGTGDLLETLERIKARSNPDLQLLGVLVTMIDRRTALSKNVEEQIRKAFTEKAFKTTISRSIRLEESPASKETIFTFSPRSVGSKQYEKLCQEVIERLV